MDKRTRLNLTIKREFQCWLLWRITASVLISAVLAGVILYCYAHQEIGDTFFDAHVRIKRVSDLLLPVILAGSAVSLLSGFFLALFLPQKIAGPVYRIEQDLGLIQQGDLARRIRLRQGDQLQDLATTINATVDTLVLRIAEAEAGQHPASVPAPCP